jgi:hypothetical protein
VLAFVVMLMIYRLAGSGAGDVKLATALGSLLGPAAVVEMLVCTYIFAGVLVLAWIILHTGALTLFGGMARRIGSFLLPVWVAAPSEEQTRQLQRKIRLGPFFALATLTVLSGAAAVVAAWLEVGNAL